MKLFFRCDDLGWHNDKFNRLLNLFRQHGHKVNAAAIPAACSDHIKHGMYKDHSNHLEVHTHGFTHLDHEPIGKKCEFGKSRNTEAVFVEFASGRETLADIFGDLYYPAFTPPWNRMEDKFIPLLREAGYLLLSRDGDKKAHINELKELNVDIDLHTSKTPVAWTPDSLYDEVERLGEFTGIMLHHKHMEEADYIFLENFLKLLTKKEATTYFFREMIDSEKLSKFCS